MKSYRNQNSWKEMQYYLPESNRINDYTYPDEKWWEWKNKNIHLDHYINEEAKAKIIILHGVGGNGRLLSFIAVPLYRRGFEVFCPDLPGYGLTDYKNNVNLCIIHGSYILSYKGEKMAFFQPSFFFFAFIFLK